MVKKKDLNASIAELLPEGLDENLINGIAKLLSDKINEENKKVTEDLTRKTLAFIRGQIEKLKEHALKELELENETFRNAQLFETVRSMFSVELTGDDEINAANILATVNEANENKMEILVKELDRIQKDNIKLKNALKITLDKNKLLESSVEELTDELSVKAEGVGSKNKVMSDSAVVVNESMFNKSKKEEKSLLEAETTENEWLSPKMIELSRSLNR